MLLLSFQSTQAWYDSNAGGTSPDWHYRVPINIPAGAPVNSTIKFDVDFNPLVATFGHSGTFDINSPRIVRANESLASSQEFTDRIYNNVLDPALNARGEVKFILQDAGPATYYLYFDTTENGAKPVNPRPSINGNFEHSIGTTPTNWIVSSVNAGGNQNNEVHDTSFADTFSLPLLTCSDLEISNSDNAPNNAGSTVTTTGRKWHLNGYRNKCEDPTIRTRKNINLSKTFSVPSSNPGNMTFYFQLQAYDSWDGNNEFDYFKLRVNGTLVNHTNLGILNPTNGLRINASGIGRRNPFSPDLFDFGWKQATLDLNAYAGSNITIMFTTDFADDIRFRTWVKLDDIEWSIRTATLGASELLPPTISMQKTSQVISDGVNTTHPKRIPGAIVEYTIAAINSGFGITDNNSIAINDAIPANSKFVVNSMQFINGTPSSGLTATTANFSYSINGTTYNNTQSLATRHIRVSPQGQFAAATGAGNPSFQVKFKVKID